MKAVQKVFLYMILFGVSLFLATTSAMAGGKVKTQSAAQLSANWWQWQEANYPAWDFGGLFPDCSIGQLGEIWYLGGSDGSGPIERECIEPIPAGKKVFFPLVNAVFHNEEGENFSVEEKRGALYDTFGDLDQGNPFATEVCKLSAMLDGEPFIFSGTPIQRVQSRPFSYAADSKAVSDGFWVLSPKLSLGEHTIEYTGSVCASVDWPEPYDFIKAGDSVFDVDITYLFNVVK